MRLRIIGLLTVAFGLLGAAPAYADDSNGLAAVDQFLGGKAQVVGAPVARYELNPAFVTNPGAPVAKLLGTATTAVTADGKAASVWKGLDGKVVNIASGSDERDYAAKGAGGTVFSEPQINAWYVLRGTTVYPLNADARRSIGDGVSISGYQKIVHSRYADKMPGSAYDQSGAAGGASLLDTPRTGGISWLPWLSVAALAMILILFAPRRRGIRR